MTLCLRLLTGLATGLVAWIAVSLFISLVTPRWDDLNPGIVWFPAVICGPLGLFRHSRPLLIALALAVAAFAFGCLLSYTARPGDDGTGMAGALLVVLAILFAVGAVPATAAHWGLMRLRSRIRERGDKAA